MEHYRPRDAAAEIGVSYPTLKQWIYKGKLRTVKTPGGHHRIPATEVRRLAGRPRGPRPSKPLGLDAISGRNKLQGRIVAVRFDGLLAQVTIDVGEQSVTSIITSD